MPQDADFNRVVQKELDAPSERVLFIDTENRIRYTVHRASFSDGVVRKIHHSLNKSGALKAVVHVARKVKSDGTCVSYVDYRPDHQVYRYRWTPPPIPLEGRWEEEPDQAELDAVKIFFYEELEEGEEE